MPAMLTKQFEKAPGKRDRANSGRSESDIKNVLAKTPLNWNYLFDLFENNCFTSLEVCPSKSLHQKAFFAC